MVPDGALGPMVTASMGQCERSFSVQLKLSDNRQPPIGFHPAVYF